MSTSSSAATPPFSSSSTSSFPSASFSSSSSSSLPFSACPTVADNCYSNYTQTFGYCCPNSLCDPYNDCSFGANDPDNQLDNINSTAAVSTTTVLFSLCLVLFVLLLYRRWRLRREFASQLQYLSYLEASDEHERERRMAASALHMDDAVELNDIRAAADDDGGGGEAEAAVVSGRRRGGFKAFTGRAFKLGELDDEGESTALHNSGQRVDGVVDSQHSIDVSLDGAEEEDEKTP